MKISAILPLKMSGRHYADNVARCDILFASLRAFAAPGMFDRFVIVVPHDEVEAARRYAKAWSDFNVDVIDESGPFAVFGDYMARHQIRNWHRQQIIKLAASELIDTEYFLVFDPDCFATQPFTIDSLLPGGKALTYEQPRKLEPSYWTDSAATLGVDSHMERDGIWMTPAILSRTLCRSLHSKLEEVHGKPWMNVLLERYMINWTEYTLYWLNAESQGLLDGFHTLTGPMPLHTKESIWYSGLQGENLDKWDAGKYFTGGDGAGIFAVIQSNTGLNVHQIADKLRPYMPITIQPYDRHQSMSLKIAELYSAVVRRIMGKMRKAAGKNG